MPYNIVWLQQWLADIMPLEEHKVTQNRYIFGLTDLHIEGDWRWIDNVPVDPKVR